MHLLAASAIVGGQTGTASGKPEQQVVVVGDHPARAFAGMSDLGIDGLRPALDQFHHVVEVSQPSPLP